MTKDLYWMRPLTVDANGTLLTAGLMLGDTEQLVPAGLLGTANDPTTNFTAIPEMALDGSFMVHEYTSWPSMSPGDRCYDSNNNLIPYSGYFTEPNTSYVNWTYTNIPMVQYPSGVTRNYALVNAADLSGFFEFALSHNEIVLAGTDTAGNIRVASSVDLGPVRTYSQRFETLTIMSPDSEYDQLYVFDGEDATSGVEYLDVYSYAGLLSSYNLTAGNLYIGATTQRVASGGHVLVLCDNNTNEPKYVFDVWTGIATPIAPTSAIHTPLWNMFNEYTTSGSIQMDTGGKLAVYVHNDALYLLDLINQTIIRSYPYIGHWNPTRFLNVQFVNRGWVQETRIDQMFTFQGQFTNNRSMSEMAV